MSQYPYILTYLVTEKKIFFLLTVMAMKTVPGPMSHVPVKLCGFSVTPL